MKLALIGTFRDLPLKNFVLFWFKHFYGVLNAVNSDSTDPQFLKYIVEVLPLLGTHTELAAPLNGPVTAGELNSIIKNIKTGKTTFSDDISHDILKLGLPVLEKASLHLFNNVMHVQTFPETWTEGLISPIHKTGDKLSVDNYRGIITSTAIDKIFLKVIASRIDSYLNTLNRWFINQCGFKKDNCTGDNLFILTNWGRETHICVGNLTIIGSDNGLSPGRRQDIIGTNVGILLIGTVGTKFSEILIEKYIFSFKKMHFKVSSGKWRPLCLGPMC